MPAVTSGAFFGLLSQDDKEEALREVAELAAARFSAYVDAVKEATGMRRLPGEQRRDAYVQRSPEIWARLQAQFPRMHEEQLQDWHRLERAVVIRSPSAAIATSPRAMRAAAASTPLPSMQGLV